MNDGHYNGAKWMRGMTETLVALLLVAAVTGSVWTAIEVRSLSIKLDSISGRIDRIDNRVERNSLRLNRVSSE